MKTGDNVKEHPQRLELRERIIDTALKSFGGSRNLVGISIYLCQPKKKKLSVCHSM